MVSANRWLDSVRLEVGSLGWNEIPSKDTKTASYLQCVHLNAIIQFCAMDLVCGVWFHCWLNVHSCWKKWSLHPWCTMLTSSVRTCTLSAFNTIPAFLSLFPLHVFLRISTSFLFCLPPLLFPWPTFHFCFFLSHSHLRLIRERQKCTEGPFKLLIRLEFLTGLNLRSCFSGYKT